MPATQLLSIDTGRSNLRSVASTPASTPPGTPGKSTQGPIHYPTLQAYHTSRTVCHNPITRCRYEPPVLGKLLQLEKRLLPHVEEFPKGISLRQWGKRPMKQHKPVDEFVDNPFDEPLDGQPTAYFEDEFGAWKPIVDPREPIDTSPAQIAIDLNSNKETTTLHPTTSPNSQIEHRASLHRDMSEAGTSVTESVSELSDISDSSNGSFQLGASFPYIDRDARKRALVDSVMDQFMAFFSNCRLPSHIILATNGAGGGDARGQVGEMNGTSGSKTQSPSSNKSKGKRMVDEVYDDGDEGHDENGERPRKRPKDENSENAGETRKFACPYFKRNRRKYQRFRSCPGPGWDTVHRMK
jgi:hypothetical protein